MTNTVKLRHVILCFLYLFLFFMYIVFGKKIQFALYASFPHKLVNTYCINFLGRGSVRYGEIAIRLVKTNIQLTSSNDNTEY